MADPNDGTTVAGDITNMRHYSTDSIGAERRAMTDEEMRALTKPEKEKTKRISGELSFGVGGRL